MRHSDGRARRGPCALQIAKDGPAGGNPLSGRRERKGGILEEERPGGLGAARRGWERRPLGGSGAEPSRDENLLAGACLGHAPRSAER